MNPTSNWVGKAYWNAFTLWHAHAEGRLPYRPLEEIVAVQDRRVKAIVKHAYETVPYYREAMSRAGLQPRDFRTAADLAQLPVLTGEEFARAPERFLSQAYRIGDGLKIQSSGSSGRPKELHYDRAALFLALAQAGRQRLVIAQFVGRRFGYREMSCVRSKSVRAQIRDFYEANSWTPRSIDLRRSIVSPGNTFEQNIGHINAFQPDVIIGYGSYLGALFRWAWTEHRPLFRPRLVLYGAEPLPDADRLLIERDFGVPVLANYQAAEALRIGFQCERRQGLHLCLDAVAVRVVGEQGSTLGPGGTGSIIVSNLTNRATVLLNYKLGDVVTLGSGPCPCGRTLPTIERVVGRSDDLLVLPGGQVGHALVVLEDLRAVPGVVQVQIVQEELRGFVLHVVCAPDTDWPLAARRLATAMYAIVGNDASLTIRRLDVISPEPGGKVRAVISRCRR